jgi:hypothetical protein
MNTKERNQFFHDYQNQARRRREFSTREHQMHILHDEGLYRHLKFEHPSRTDIWRFHIVTWPGHLTITGDLESYTFCAAEDMLDFFTQGIDPTTGINASYWAEKVRAESTQSPVKEYCPDLFERIVETEYAKIPEICNHDERTLEDWASIKEDMLGQAQWSEEDARRVGREYPELFPNQDVNLVYYSWHYLLSCHAVAWAAKQYRTAKIAA